MIRSERLFLERGIDHGFSTRIGGISEPPFDTLNLGTSRNEPMSNILTNYRILCSAYGLDYDDLALVRHEHGSNILRLTGEDRGRGLDREPLEYSDGLVTNDPSVTLVTCHADCSAFFFYDKKHGAIGLAHAGWKGMYARIGQKMVLRMHDEFGTDPSDLSAVIGPCICEKCFEVDLNLGEAFEKEFDCPDILAAGTGKKSDKAYVSLRAAALIQLLDAGMSESSISIMDHCTMEEKDLFYSYRRDGKDTGSMAAYLKLNR
ncbi:MAG: peptidoglycan editing factor PgeF [Clostridia bacterium]|nr:peptidoglycan editing factor PgeF [Clostridia bacterium]